MDQRLLLVQVPESWWSIVQHERCRILHTYPLVWSYLQKKKKNRFDTQIFLATLRQQVSSIADRG